MQRNTRLPLIKRALTETLRQAMKMRDVSGTALIEFAFVMPLLMMMLVGMFMFGLTIHDYISVTGAAEAGMLQLTVSRGSTTPWTTTKNVIYAAAPTLLQTSLTISMTVNGTVCTTGATDAVKDTACTTALSTAAGLPASVTVRYPCKLKVLKVSYLNNCTVSATPTGRVQ
jgi:Flp pilus assembly protein TadG